MSTEKITAQFKMARAVLDDTETAALEAANAHTFQLDGLSKQVTALTQENGELALEAARLRKQHVGDSAAAAELFQTTQRLRSEREAAVAELGRLMDLDMMRLQMPDGYVAETIEQALRGWKAGYDEAVAANKQMQTQRAFAQAEAREARAELAHAREQLAATLATIEKATTEAANAVVYANVDTSLRDPRAGKLLVVRLDGEDAISLAHQSQTITFWTSQCVGWLEAAQDEGDTETRDVHHAGMPAPVVRCGECTSVNGHFGDCAKAVQP